MRLGFEALETRDVPSSFRAPSGVLLAGNLDFLANHKNTTLSFPDLTPNASRLNAGFGGNGSIPSAKAASPAVAATAELIVYNANLPDAQLLIDGFKSNWPGRSFQILSLDTNRDGIKQLTSFLTTSNTRFGAVHFLVHGGNGVMVMGSTLLNGQNLDSYRTQMAQWRRGLTAHADLLFYGCDVAQNQAGKSMMRRVAQLTGEDVGASTDSTGSAILGGNWKLEFTVGQIDRTHKAIAKNLNGWNHLLGFTPLGGGIGAFAACIGNRLYSVNFDTGKATLMFTDAALAANGINSLGFDSVNDIYYYADNGNGSTAIYGWNARTGGPRFVVTTDITTFGVVLPAAGLGAAGGDFNGGSYYFSTEGGGVGNADQLYKMDFLAGSNGQTAQSVQLISNTAIPGANEFGDFIVDAAAGKFYSFNSGTGVVEYNMVLGGTPSLTLVQTDASAAIRQAALDRNNQMYAVDGNFRTYNPAGAGTFGATKNITTDGTTAFGSAFDSAAYLAADGSIGDRVWFDSNTNGAQDPGEPGVVGVTLTIYYDLNGDGIINGADSAIASTTSGVDGAYSFGQLLPDTYIVQVTDPTNIMNGGASTTGGNTQAATIALIGQSITTKDFGYQDNRPTVTVTNVTGTEGADNFAVFSVNLSTTSLSPISVNLALANGTALGAGTDYGTGGVGNLQVSTDGGLTWVDATSATIAVGQSNVLVRTPIVNDTLHENTESFTLTATVAAGNTANASANGTGTILDNDPLPSLTINDVTVNEATGTATFTVTLNAASGLTTTVDFATSNGTATAGADYSAAAGTLTFAPGVTTQTITVPITNDTVFENSEFFNVNLSNPTNATIADNLGVGTILDNGGGTGGPDDDTPTLAVSNVTVTEGTNPFAVFTVSLNNQSTTPVAFNLGLTNGTALGSGIDYGTVGVGNLQVSTDGGLTWGDAVSATIAPLTSSILVRTPINNDAINETTEAFALTATITAGTTTNASATGTGTILDNDPLPSLTINDLTVNEATGTATFTVTLSATSGLPVTVDFATSNGTAAAGADYSAAAGTLTFAPGVLTQTITVPITNDTLFENSEFFNVNLSNSTNATIADNLGVGTILDNGGGTGGTDNDTPTLSDSSVTITEGSDPFAVFTVSLSNQSTTPVNFNLGLTNGTALGSGVDYGTVGVGNLQVSTDGGLTWGDAVSATIAPLTSSILVRTPINNDAINETTETFSLTATVTAGTTTNASATGTGTILDDDGSPTLSINDLVVNEATGTATFTVTVSATSGLPVTVDFATSNGTATAGADYSAAAGTLTFAPGVLTQTITVPITNDTIFENSEFFNVNLSNPTNATVADNLGIGTILDNGNGTGGTDNDTPTLAVSSVTVTEGIDPFAVFTVSLSNLSTTPVTVGLALSNGTALGAGTDFGTAGLGNLQVSTDGGLTWVDAVSATIAPLTTSVLVRTPIVNDTLDENTEAFTLTATVTAGTTVNASATGTGTILDDDGSPTLSINDLIVNEATGTATFTVTLSATSGLPVTVDFATSNGTATAGADYSAAAGTLTFAPGVLTQTITVPITNDTIFENSEFFNVNLSNPTNATVADNLGIGTILDNGNGTGGTDNDTSTLAVSSVTVTEGTDPFAVFTVSLSNLSTTPVSFNLGLTNGTALGSGIDYGTGGAGNLQVSTDGGLTWSDAISATIAPLTSSILVRTPINNDAISETTEAFSLTATVTAGTTTNPSASGTGTILDNDGTPTLSINDLIVNEATGTATFTVTLSAASGLPITVDFATSNGTATAGADYTAAAGTLTFAPGVLTQTITVPITNDTIFENSEFFNINLSNPTNATIADNLGVGTILDNGNGTGGTDNDTPTLAVSSVTVTEGIDPFAVFTVSLSNQSTSPVTVGLTLTNGTALGTGTDYGTVGLGNLQVSTDGGLTWVDAVSATIAPLTSSVLVRTPIVNDAISESTENFSLTATVTAGTTTNVSAAGTGTILDNDGAPNLTINDLTINEAAGTATFTVTLSAASGLPVTVDFATSNGTATAGADYTAAGGTLTFAPGVITQTITVPITNDTIFENSEFFNVNLSNPTNATIADNLGIGTILDNGNGLGGTDNDTPTLAVSSITVTEGTDPFAVFTVSLSNLSTTPVTVGLALADGTAFGSGFDYGTVGVGNLQVSTDGGLTWVDAVSATIAPLTVSVLVRTPINNDTFNEGTENFTLTATVTAGTTTNAAATGTGTILDNDGPPTISINDVTVNEAAGTATFTVTLSAASGLPVTVDFATSNGTATVGADYTATAGTVTFAPSLTTQTITIPITNDTIFENSEFFNVNLSNPTNATVADNLGVGTILDNGNGTGGTDNDTPTLSVSNVTVTEGVDPFAVFTVSLNNLSTTPVTVGLALANGTAQGAGTDFGTGGAGNLQVSTDGGLTWVDAVSATIAPLTASVLVRTPIVNDILGEGTENFTLTATVTAGITTNPAATGTGTILDNDGVPSLTINDITVNEAAGTATFTVTLSVASGLPVTVDFATSNGTATAGADYTAVNGTLTFAPGVTTQTITVPIINDTIFENSENFNVNLSNPTNATIGDNLGVGTILDNGNGTGGTDNDTPTLAVSSVTVTEGVNPFAVFTVSLSNLSTTPVTVALALANVTALGGGTDYGTAGVGNLQISTDGGLTWADAASATIAAGTTSVLVRTPIVNDAISEPPEKFTLKATVTAGTTTNPSATGTGTINDNDVAMSAIRGFVFVDANDNGIKDANERGIGGVVIRLTGTDDLGHAVKKTIVTDASGRYAFIQMRPGTYNVIEIQPAAFVNGRVHRGDSGGIVGVNVVTGITLFGGVNATNYNFGERGLSPDYLSKRMAMTIPSWGNPAGQPGSGVAKVNP